MKESGQSWFSESERIVQEFPIGVDMHDLTNETLWNVLKQQ